MRYTRAVTYVLLAACMAGCQPAPTPTPSSPSVVATGPDIEPTYECTPEFPSPSPSPRPTTCSKDAYDRMKARDTQYAEAERIYRQFHDVDSRLARGDDSGVEGLSQLTSDELSAEIRAAYAADRRERLLLRGGSTELVWVRRAQTEKAGSSLALETCTDSSSAQLIRRGKVIGAGPIVHRVMEFKNIGGRLLMWDASYIEGAPCVDS